MIDHSGNGKAIRSTESIANRDDDNAKKREKKKRVHDSEHEQRRHRTTMATTATASSSDGGLRGLPGYSLGDALRREDEDSILSPEDAEDGVMGMTTTTTTTMTLLIVGDRAFVGRSDGSFTYAVYEGQHAPQDEQLLSFRVDDKGRMKVVRRGKLASRVRIPTLSPMEEAERRKRMIAETNKTAHDGESGGEEKNDAYADHEREELDRQPPNNIETLGETERLDAIRRRTLLSDNQTESQRLFGDGSEANKNDVDHEKALAKTEKLNANRRRTLSDNQTESQRLFGNDPGDGGEANNNNNNDERRNRSNPSIEEMVEAKIRAKALRHTASADQLNRFSTAGLRSSASSGRSKTHHNHHRDGGLVRPQKKQQQQPPRGRLTHTSIPPPNIAGGGNNGSSSSIRVTSMQDFRQTRTLNTVPESSNSNETFELARNNTSAPSQLVTATTPDSLKLLKLHMRATNQKSDPNVSTARQMLLRRRASREQFDHASAAGGNDNTNADGACGNGANASWGEAHDDDGRSHYSSLPAGTIRRVCSVDGMTREVTTIMGRRSVPRREHDSNNALSDMLAKSRGNPADGSRLPHASGHHVPALHRHDSHNVASNAVTAGGGANAIRVTSMQDFQRARRTLNTVPESSYHGSETFALARNNNHASAPSQMVTTTTPDSMKLLKLHMKATMNNHRNNNNGNNTANGGDGMTAAQKMLMRHRASRENLAQRRPPVSHGNDAPGRGANASWEDGGAATNVNPLLAMMARNQARS